MSTIGCYKDRPAFVCRNAALMAASLWEPAPPVGLVRGDGRSGREDFAYGWEGTEWDASRPEALLRRVQRGPGKAEEVLRGGSAGAKVDFGAKQNTPLREEARTGWETHQVTQGSRKKGFSSKSKAGAQSHGRSSTTLVKVVPGAAAVLRSVAGLQGFLKPFLVNRSGQPKVLGSKIIRSSPQRTKTRRKENGPFAKGYIPCHNVGKLWSGCSRPAKHSASWRSNALVKRYDEHHQHHHKNPPHNSRSRKRSSKYKTQRVPPGRSTRLFSPKQPPWPTSQARPANLSHISKDVKTNEEDGKGRVKFEQQNGNPQTTFSLSFDPTVSMPQSQFENPGHTGQSFTNPNATSPPRRPLLIQHQKTRVLPKTSRTRESSSLTQASTHQSLAHETHSRSPRISNLSMPSQSRTQPKKSHREKFPSSFLRKPHSFPASSPNPQGQRNRPRQKSSPSSSFKAKKSRGDSHSPLPRAPIPRPHQSSPQQTLKKQQWQQPARTAQGWVNIKCSITQIQFFFLLL